MKIHFRQEANHIIIFPLRMELSFRFILNFSECSISAKCNQSVIFLLAKCSLHVYLLPKVQCSSTCFSIFGRGFYSLLAPWSCCRTMTEGFLHWYYRKNNSRFRGTRRPVECIAHLPANFCRDTSKIEEKLKIPTSKDSDIRVLL